MSLEQLQTYIYMIIVGKSMPIDNYEQYKRVINQITGRLYIYILEIKIMIFYDFFYFLFFYDFFGV